jgi:predicted transposase/invertase (TIGR01784 family)
MLELPENLKQAFRAELAQYEQERQMPYVTSIEQMGIEQGRQEGRQEERRSLALKRLQQNIPIETIARITEFSIAQLQPLQAENP